MGTVGGQGIPRIPEESQGHTVTGERVAGKDEATLEQLPERLRVIISHAGTRREGRKKIPRVAGKGLKDRPGFGAEGRTVEVTENGN